MNYKTLLDRIISDGIAEVREAYAAPAEHHKRDGAVEGFEACRDRSPAELAELWRAAEDEASKMVREQRSDGTRYWKLRYKALQIEFVCNVVSVGLVNSGHPPLLGHLPTVRGAMKYAEVVGVGAEARS